MAEPVQGTLHSPFTGASPVPASCDADAVVPTEGNGCRTHEAGDHEEAALDWDVKIETPPARPSRLVAARFVHGGRRPIRIEDELRD